MSFSPEELKKANSKAVMVRVEVKNSRQYSGQRKHDLRIGPQPKYVAADRADLNRVVIEPPRPKALKDACNARREARGVKRAMKSNAGIAAVGIVGFGSEAKKIFEELSQETQDAAFLEVGQAVAEEANTRLVGLVVHLDETSIHAHLTFEGYDMDGRPLSDTMKRGMMRRFQDRAAEVMVAYAPGIERGRSRVVRQQNGASYAETLHASVADLHERLPTEIAAAEAKLDALEGAIAKNQGYIDKLREKSELNAKEAKRLATYEGRLRKAIEGHREEKGRLDEFRSTLKQQSDALASQTADLSAKEQELKEREKKLAEREFEATARELQVAAQVEELKEVERGFLGFLEAVKQRLGVQLPEKKLTGAVGRLKAFLQKYSADPEDPFEPR